MRVLNDSTCWDTHNVGGNSKWRLLKFCCLPTTVQADLREAAYAAVAQQYEANGVAHAASVARQSVERLEIRYTCACSELCFCAYATVGPCS